MLYLTFGYHFHTQESKDFLPKLKEHLLPRLKDMLQKEDRFCGTLPHELEANKLFFKNDRLYMHRIFHINYTTYDVRRAQDVVNPHTSRSNILVLSNSDSDDSSDHFLYARVLGIYHANVIYTGAGMLNYQPRRIEFLWVRWFQAVDSKSGWDVRRLDCLKFPPLNSQNAFGFLDPADVVRGCHIIPRLSVGNIRGNGISQCANDSKDWPMYYVNRFVQCLSSLFPINFSTLWSDLLTGTWSCVTTGDWVLDTSILTQVPVPAYQ